MEQGHACTILWKYPFPGVLHLFLYMCYLILAAWNITCKKSFANLTDKTMVLQDFSVYFFVSYRIYEYIYEHTCYLYAYSMYMHIYVVSMCIYCKFMTITGSFFYCFSLFLRVFGLEKTSHLSLILTVTGVGE